MIDRKQLEDRFRNFHELSQHISTLVENALDADTLALMCTWDIFQSTLLAIKIPHGHIFKILKIFHIDNDSSKVNVLLQDTNNKKSKFIKLLGKY